MPERQAQRADRVANMHDQLRRKHVQLAKGARCGFGLEPGFEWDHLRDTVLKPWQLAVCTTAETGLPDV